MHLNRESWIICSWISQQLIRLVLNFETLTALDNDTHAMMKGLTHFNHRLVEYLIQLKDERKITPKFCECWLSRMKIIIIPLWWEESRRGEENMSQTRNNNSISDTKKSFFLKILYFCFLIPQNRTFKVLIKLDRAPMSNLTLREGLVLQSHYSSNL